MPPVFEQYYTRLPLLKLGAMIEFENRGTLSQFSIISE